MLDHSFHITSPSNQASAIPSCNASVRGAAKKYSDFSFNLLFSLPFYFSNANNSVEFVDEEYVNFMCVFFGQEHPYPKVYPDARPSSLHSNR